MLVEHYSEAKELKNNVIQKMIDAVRYYFFIEELWCEWSAENTS
jgi:hypothetical protein